jgi:hypothetical protein
MDLEGAPYGSARRWNQCSALALLTVPPRCWSWRRFLRSGVFVQERYGLGFAGFAPPDVTKVQREQ